MGKSKNILKNHRTSVWNLRILKTI